MQTKLGIENYIKIKGDFHPGLLIDERVETLGSLRLSFADLAPSGLRALSTGLIEAQEKLRAVSIFQIVDWIDRAGARWRDPNHAFRKEAEKFIPLTGIISKEMLPGVLDDLGKTLARPILLDFLEAELGDANRLDRFCPKEKGLGLTRAFGPRLTTHIVPSNIGVISIISLVCGLLAKSANLVRVSPQQSLLPVLFARSLHEIWPEMAKTIAILSWDKSALALTEAAFQNADCVIVYGSDETLTTLCNKIPVTTKAIRYGHRFSLGIVARESASKALAGKAALDIALYDQKGCLSPHLYYVESGGETSPLAFAQDLAQALQDLALHLPKSATSPGEAARIQQIRGALPLKSGAVFSSCDGLDWTVLYDPDPTLTCSPLSRSIWIKPVVDLSEVPPLLEPYRLALQAIGYAIPEARQADLISKMAQIGGSRMCPIGQMQKPPLTWHHDGGFRLLPLLRFVDWEQP